MELFCGEKIGDIESNSIRKCHACGKKIDLVRVVLIETNGSVIRMFECKCGERISRLSRRLFVPPPGCRALFWFKTG